MSEKLSQKSYLHQLIQDRLTQLKPLLRWYARRYYLVSMSTVFLSALITVLAGIKPSGLPSPLGITEDVASNVVLVLGAVITVVAAWGAFFSPREAWHLHAETYAQLRALQVRLEFDERAPDFASREAKILAERFDQYQRILEEHNSRWQQLLQKAK